MAPYTLVQYLYRSVSNFRRPANVLKYSDHEKLFLRLFYDEIAKCSVHSNIFVKPKQYMSCVLVRSLVFFAVVL